MEQIDQKTNFFTIIEALLAGGTDVTLTLSKVGEKLVVAVRPQRQDLKGGDALNAIRPLMLMLSKHTAAELDESFFATVTQPLGEFNQAADEIASWKAEVGKAKETATTAKAKSTPAKPAQTKKPAPAKKAVTKKPSTPSKPKAPASPKVTPEQKAEVLAKKAEALLEKQTKEIKGLITAADNHTKAGRFNNTKQVIDKGMRLVKAIGDDKPVKAMLIADMEAAQTRATDILAKRKGEENEKKIVPILKKATAQITGANFGEGGKTLKSIFDIDPNHAGGLALRALLVDKLGEPTVVSLIK